MIKLIAFDLDNTLAELGKGIAEKDLKLLKNIERRGIAIAVCSGKPIYYLCGFMRQAGLEHPILVGENGAVIQMDVDLPPEEYYVLPYSKKAEDTIMLMREKITEFLPDIWYQPNQVGLTPFPKGKNEFQIIEDCLSEYENELEDVVVYRHVDSFDIMPVGIDKKRGMEFLGSLLEIRPEETAVVGDGVNDYPMFEYASYAVGVNVEAEERVNVNFTNITEALEHLSEKIAAERTE